MTAVEMPEPGQTWRHVKSERLYRILALPIDAEHDEVSVCYAPVQPCPRSMSIHDADVVRLAPQHLRESGGNSMLAELVTSAILETERVVRFVKETPGSFDTCFRLPFETILKRHHALTDSPRCVRRLGNFLGYDPETHAPRFVRVPGDSS